MTQLSSQEWFEMVDLRRRRFATAVWVPLRASKTIKNEDGSEETLAAGCVAFPEENRAEAEELGWIDIGLGRDGGPYAFNDGSYKPCEVFQYNDGDDLGIDFIFTQSLGGDHQYSWHISQDLILALQLLQESDIWVSPKEGYTEVIRQHKNDENRITLIEIKSEFLKDYLAARGLALRLATYRQRVATFKDASHINWPNNRISEENQNDRFTAGVYEIDAEGGPFGSDVAIFRTWRTDVDPEEDVPVFDQESDENTDGRSARYSRVGEKFYRVEGELWREEWIEPTSQSRRVRGDKPEETFSYITDSSGQRMNNDELNSEDVGRYLWFDPSIITTLNKKRGGGFRWFTKDTGSVWAYSDWTTHFGVNEIGLINIYAYDIAKLPEWQQRIWQGFNVSPEGRVSSELLSMQMQCRPASTDAPEVNLFLAIHRLDKLVAEWAGSRLFMEHVSIREITKDIHRFRAIDQNGLLALAKDVARLIVDRIDVATLQNIVAPTDGNKWGSLKHLEKSLASLVSAENARALLTPLVGIYELRLGDAHLPSSKVQEAFQLVGIDPDAKVIHQGEQLIESAAITLENIYAVIESIVKLSVQNR